MPKSRGPEALQIDLSLPRCWLIIFLLDMFDALSFFFSAPEHQLLCQIKPGGSKRNIPVCHSKYNRSSLYWRRYQKGKVLCTAAEACLIQLSIESKSSDSPPGPYSPSHAPQPRIHPQSPPFGSPPVAVPSASRHESTHKLSAPPYPSAQGAGRSP